MNYLQILVEQIHSSTVATIAEDGHPQTRVIDMMLWDENGVYFLTAKGKQFYSQLTRQGFIALSATKDKISISLRGKIKNIGTEKLNEIFKKNTYMQGLYPNNTRTALEVFQIYEAQGEYFDITTPTCIVRDSFTIGNAKAASKGYYVDSGCIMCGKCQAVCPQSCIDLLEKTAVINSKHCLNCGRCAEACPKKIIHRG